MLNKKYFEICIDKKSKESDDFEKQIKSSGRIKIGKTKNY